MHLKKIAAILLLSILCFNWFGYRLWLDYRSNQADKVMEAKANLKAYDDQQLVEIRIPLSIPYYSNWDDFERHDGSIELNGVQYNYVKRKVQDGQLILLCLPNHEKQLVKASGDQYFKLINDLGSLTQHGKKSGSEKASTFKGFQFEYFAVENKWVINIFDALAIAYGSGIKGFMSETYIACPEQPPDLV